jgi:hypothetical protein
MTEIQLGGMSIKAIKKVSNMSMDGCQNLLSDIQSKEKPKVVISDDYIKNVEKILGIQLYSYQREVLKTILSKKNGNEPMLITMVKDSGRNYNLMEVFALCSKKY